MTHPINIYKQIADRYEVQKPEKELPKSTVPFEKKTQQKVDQFAVDLLRDLNQPEANQLAQEEKMGGFEKWFFVNMRWLYLLFAKKPAAMGQKILNEWTAIRSDKQKKKEELEARQRVLEAEQRALEAKQQRLRDRIGQAKLNNPSMPPHFITAVMNKNHETFSEIEVHDPAYLLAEALISEQESNERKDSLLEILRGIETVEKENSESLLIRVYLQDILKTAHESHLVAEVSVPEIQAILQSITIDYLQTTFDELNLDQVIIFSDAINRKTLMTSALKVIVHQEIEKEQLNTATKKEELENNLAQKRREIFQKVGEIEALQKDQQDKNTKRTEIQKKNTFLKMDFTFKKGEKKKLLQTLNEEISTINDKILQTKESFQQSKNEELTIGKDLEAAQNRLQELKQVAERLRKHSPQSSA